MAHYKEMTPDREMITAGPIISLADKLSLGHSLYSYAKALKPTALTTYLLQELGLTFEKARVYLECEVISVSNEPERTSLLKILHDCYVELCNLSTPEKLIFIGDVPIAAYHQTYAERESQLAKVLGL